MEYHIPDILMFIKICPVQKSDTLLSGNGYHGHESRKGFEFRIKKQINFLLL